MTGHPLQYLAAIPLTEQRDERYLKERTQSVPTARPAGSPHSHHRNPRK
jgi:hypothetical protein